MALYSAGSLIFLGCLASLSFLLLRIQTYADRSKFKAAHKCQPPGRYPHKDPLGIDWLLQSKRRLQQGNLISGLRGLYNKYGDTFQTYSLGQTVINTVEPENVKSILSLNTASYAIAPMRYPAAGPVVGHNVFTTDGSFWKMARAEVKSIFTHAHTADSVDFTRHLDRFMAQTPRDGSTFDVAPLLDELVGKPWPLHIAHNADRIC
jgi:cytochrome P450